MLNSSKVRGRLELKSCFKAKIFLFTLFLMFFNRSDSEINVFIERESSFSRAHFLWLWMLLVNVKVVTWWGHHSLPFLEEACLETVPGAEVVGLVP